MRSSNYTRTSYLMALFAERYTSRRSPGAAEAFRYSEAGNGGYVGVSGSVWKNAFWTPAGFRC